MNYTSRLQNEYYNRNICILAFPGGKLLLFILFPLSNVLVMGHTHSGPQVVLYLSWSLLLLLFYQRLHLTTGWQHATTTIGLDRDLNLGPPYWETTALTTRPPSYRDTVNKTNILIGRPSFQLRRQKKMLGEMAFWVKEPWSCQHQILL